MKSSDRAVATRRAILAAARACFAETGLAGTSTRAIAVRAGITQPLIHHYFGTKESLFEAVIAESVTDYDDVQGVQWALPPGDLRFFTTGLVVLFRWLGERPEMLRLSEWARLEGHLESTALMVPIYRRVRAQLQAAQERGTVRGDLDLDAAIIMIESLFKGFWDRLATYAHYPTESETLESRFLRTSMETLLRGLLTPDVLDEALVMFEEALAAHQ